MLEVMVGVGVGLIVRELHEEPHTQAQTCHRSVRSLPPPHGLWNQIHTIRHGSRHLCLLSHLPPIHPLSLLGANPRKPCCLDPQASSAHVIRGSEREGSSVFSPLLHAWDRILGPVRNKLTRWKKDLILAQPSSPGPSPQCPASCPL